MEIINSCPPTQAQRADLLGAIRLPNTAFKANAGTEVTSDIFFLQKRENPIDLDVDWVHLGLDDNEISMNSYFVENPDMMRQITSKPALMY
ncbi:MAG: hypothetical protein ATN35_09420 [Epulopiscium sp. Nele67-Bin004]|nr:MAG: hypothetical protein ATN35_09420 [Epulopiscium sp. Nele67-Bin004]